MKNNTISQKLKFITQISNSIRPKKAAMLCFSHLRWNFVYQRPQHLMSRFATKYNVLFIEEPTFTDNSTYSLTIRKVENNLYVLSPKIPASFSKIQTEKAQAQLLDKFLKTSSYEVSLLWYFTPMSITWTKHLTAKAIIYDCMDELAAFKNAPAELKKNEQDLISRADIIFTGGSSLYRAKRTKHQEVYLFPSSVDAEHFRISRNGLDEPKDQLYIPHPRIGFYGVIDERFDIKLIKNLAKRRLDWNFILIGPIVKINPESLPQLPNIYYLKAKTYKELPYYLSGWDVALIPFAINEATKFISPTKTPEYLAGGKPVVSTPIVDVVSTYKDVDIVRIADPENLANFINAIESAIKDNKNPEKIYQKADAVLRDMSWDNTFLNMYRLITAIQSKTAKRYLKLNR